MINRDFTLSGASVVDPISFTRINFNRGSLPYAVSFLNDIIIHSEYKYKELLSPSLPNDKVFLNSTKKAIFKINKHPSTPALQSFIANYSLDGNVIVVTPTGALPINSLAKDGDEFEIYGFDEIKKVHFGKLHSSMPPNPFLLTISLFN